MAACLNSLLAMSIQRDGAVDLLLRAIEDEQAQRHDLFGFHYQKMMSDYWIGGVYETFRLLKDRELADPAQAFAEIFADLEPTRVAIDKHELAQERKLKTPIEMVRLPQKNDASDKYVYDKTDKQRSHIMGMGISDRGSVRWLVTDILKEADRWVERRDLSDRILALWK